MPRKQTRKEVVVNGDNNTIHRRKGHVPCAHACLRKVEKRKGAPAGKARRATSKNGLFDGITKREALRAFAQGLAFVVVMFGLLYAVSTLGFYMRFGGFPWQ